MVTCLQLAGQRTKCGRHAGGNRIAGFCPFQQAEAFFQHGNGRVAIAAINIAFFFIGEAPLGRFRIFIDIAGGEVDGFRGFAMRRAVKPAAHELGGLAPACGVLLFRVFGHQL